MKLTTKGLQESLLFAHHIQMLEFEIMYLRKRIREGLDMIMMMIPVCTKTQENSAEWSSKVLTLIVILLAGPRDY